MKGTTFGPVGELLPILLPRVGHSTVSTLNTIGEFSTEGAAGCQACVYAAGWISPLVSRAPHPSAPGTPPDWVIAARIAVPRPPPWRNVIHVAGRFDAFASCSCGEPSRRRGWCIRYIVDAGRAKSGVQRFAVRSLATYFAPRVHVAHPYNSVSFTLGMMMRACRRKRGGRRIISFRGLRNWCCLRSTAACPHTNEYSTQYCIPIHARKHQFKYFGRNTEINVLG